MRGKEWIELMLLLLCISYQISILYLLRCCEFLSVDPGYCWWQLSDSFPILVGDALEPWTFSRNNSNVSCENVPSGIPEISQVEKMSCHFPQNRNERFHSAHNIDVVRTNLKRIVQYSCKICSKGFTSKLGYDNHMKQKHGTREQCFTCAVCEKMFATPSMLSVHLRVHSDYRPFECLQCGKGYKHKKDLKTHRCGQSRGLKLWRRTWSVISIHHGELNFLKLSNLVHYSLSFVIVILISLGIKNEKVLLCLVFVLKVLKDHIWHDLYFSLSYLHTVIPNFSDITKARTYVFFPERLRYEETFNVMGSDSRSGKSWPLRMWKKQEAIQDQPTSDTAVLSASYEPRHIMVQVLGSTNKACVVCKWDGVKTATGLPTKSYYRCEACDACLCRPQIRNCFERYHKHLNIETSDITWKVQFIFFPSFVIVGFTVTHVVLFCMFILFNCVHVFFNFFPSNYVYRTFVVSRNKCGAGYLPWYLLLVIRVILRSWTHKYISVKSVTNCLCQWCTVATKELFIRTQWYCCDPAVKML